MPLRGAGVGFVSDSCALCVCECVCVSFLSFYFLHASCIVMVSLLMLSRFSATHAALAMINRNLLICRWK